MRPKELMTSPGSPGKGKKARDEEVTSSSVAKDHRYHTALQVDALYNEYAPQIVRKMIDAALGGDVAAMKICIDKVTPNAKERPVRVEIPAIHSPADAVNALRIVVSEASQGNLTLSEAKDMATVVEMLRESINQEVEVKEWNLRMDDLHQKVYGEAQAVQVAQEPTQLQYDVED